MPDCIDAAIRQLGNERYVPAIDVLASYLDFKSPTYTLPADAPVYNPRWGYLYPATLALFEIGPPAIESLVRVIASPSSSDTAGTNAAETLMTINRIDMSKAVTALTTAAKATTDAVAAARLRDAARKLASTCPGPELRTKCEAALN
jgi:hypothetical protein